MEPSYLALHREGKLERLARLALEGLCACRICPRECGVDRTAGDKGFCGAGRFAEVASYNAHFGEESPLVGVHGSGTIFFSRCNLLCSFCQNYEISHLAEGTEVGPEQLAEFMLRLQDAGCHNINFVTPTHVVPQILEALPRAVDLGLRVPLVYNSSGYDRKETIAMLRGVFDIYMPDFKFWDGEWSDRYCRAPDYPQRAAEALREMHRQVGDLRLEDGVAVRGILLRHLVMPGGVAGTERILDFVAREISPDTYVNVMDQYRPCGTAGRDEWINRRLTAAEYREAVEAAKRAGLRRLDPRERPRLIFQF